MMRMEKMDYLLDQYYQSRVLFEVCIMILFVACNFQICCHIIGCWIFIQLLHSLQSILFLSSDIVWPHCLDVIFSAFLPHSLVIEKETFPDEEQEPRGNSLGRGCSYIIIPETQASTGTFLQFLEAAPLIVLFCTKINQHLIYQL